MKNILPRSFYNRPTIKVAKNLLGKFLYREINGKLYIVKIVETEAYLGRKDLACHSSKGKTERNKTMFGPPGHSYVYFIYGMHYCFNIVTEKENNPCAVLIRALEPAAVETRHCLVSTKSLNGPAKLCRELKIDKKLNGWDLTLGKKLWLENGEKIKSSQIKKSKRVGVDYAGKWKNRLLRFYIKGNKCVSRK